MQRQYRALLYFFFVSGKLIRNVLYSTWFSFPYLVIVVLGFAGILLIPVSSSKLLLDSLLGGLRQVCRLYVLLHTDQWLFQSVEGTRVQHLLLNLGRVGTPRHQEQFLFLGCLRRERYNDIPLKTSVIGELRQYFQRNTKMNMVITSEVPWHWWVYSKSNRP